VLVPAVVVFLRVLARWLVVIEMEFYLFVFRVFSLFVVSSFLPV
jgi:hypothetical protein